MRRPRLLIPAIVFVLALVAAGFTFLRDDSVPLIDTSDIDAADIDAAGDTADAADTSPRQPPPTRPHRRSLPHRPRCPSTIARARHAWTRSGSPTRP